ncbi:MAG: hypothetical protein LBO70_04475 [Clostridiales Family XIII bacterium]|jgi:hypothetical protein|nr:hypothetical protein [Clostridiales Family XIII bacterium]
MFFYKIEGNPFLADMHYMHKAMAPVDYPTTKQEIVSQIGSETVRMGHDDYRTVEEIIAPLKKEKYDCACEFYCALFANIYKG